MCLLFRGVLYWEVMLKRLSHFGLNFLSAIHGMSSISDVRYRDVSMHFMDLDLFGYYQRHKNYLKNISRNARTATHKNMIKLYDFTFYKFDQGVKMFCLLFSF